MKVVLIIFVFRGCGLIKWLLIVDNLIISDKIVILYFDLIGGGGGV